MKPIAPAVVATLYLVVASLVCDLAVAQETKKKTEPDVIFVPTPRDVVEKMLELAKADKNDVVYDLGCGDGRIVVAAAKQCGCKAVGYDIDPKRIKESLENVKKNGVEELVTIQREDIFTLDLSPASVVTLYLLPRLNVKLVPQLEQLKPGSRIVSHQYGIKGVKPDRVIKMTSKEDNRTHTVFLWTTPLKKETPDVASPATLRRWTDNIGRTIQAELIEVKDGKVVLKRADGKVGTVPLTKLSKADRDYVKSLKK